MGRQESYEDMDQPLFIREQPSQVLKDQFHRVTRQADCAQCAPTLNYSCHSHKIETWMKLRARDRAKNA